MEAVAATTQEGISSQESSHYFVTCTNEEPTTVEHQGIN